MLYRMAMVISLRIAGRILLFVPRGIKRISIFVPTWYHYRRLKASAYIPTFTVLHITMRNIPQEACSMQHDSRTASQFVHAIGNSTTDYALPCGYRVT